MGAPRVELSPGAGTGRPEGAAATSPVLTAADSAERPHPPAPSPDGRRGGEHGGRACRWSIIRIGTLGAALVRSPCDGLRVSRMGAPRVALSPGAGPGRPAGAAA